MKGARQLVGAIADLWMPCLAAALSAACSTAHSGTNQTDASGAMDGRSDATTDRADGKAHGSHDSSSPTLDGGPRITDSGRILDTGVDACLNSGIVSARRPRVFMAFSKFLASSDASVDSQWTYVREHLDGLWENDGELADAALSAPSLERLLWGKVKTRTLITEWGVQSAQTGGWWSPLVFSQAQADGGPNICRQAIAIDGDPASLWDATTIASANAVYVTNPDAAPWQRYHAVFTGWQPQEFNDGGGLTGAALQAFEASKGAAFECPLGACLGGTIYNDAFNIITKIHAQGDPFIWFASNNLLDASAVRAQDWIASFQATYNLFAKNGLWLPNDVVMLMNYNDWYPAVPETVDGGAANTVTGLAYWALHQTPIGSDE